MYLGQGHSERPAAHRLSLGTMRQNQQAETVRQS